MANFRHLATDAVIIEKNKVLLLKRKTPPFKNWWVLPGGMVELGETTEEACKREVKEETGLDIEVVKPVGFFDAPDREPRGNVAYAFLCRIKSGSIHSTEALEVEFFPLDKLPSKIGFDHLKMIQEAKKLIERDFRRILNEKVQKR